MFYFTISYFTFPLWNIQLMKKLVPKDRTVISEMQQFFLTILDKIFWEKTFLPTFSMLLVYVNNLIVKWSYKFSFLWATLNMGKGAEFKNVFFSNILSTIVLVDDMSLISAVHDINTFTVDINKDLEFIKESKEAQEIIFSKKN